MTTIMKTSLCYVVITRVIKFGFHLGISDLQHWSNR